MLATQKELLTNSSLVSSSYFSVVKYDENSASANQCRDSHI